MATISVELFTRDEHVIIADWLNTAPSLGAGELPSVADALRNLGFDGEATDSPRSDQAAAVAAIILEGVQNRLPQWSIGRESDAGDVEITYARSINDRRADRKHGLTPQFLMMINWADSGPGFSWPVAYHVTWLPIYQVFIVTESADSPDAFGYCDFAIGYFSETRDVIVAAGEAIKADWSWMRNNGQERWSYLFREGLIDAEGANQLAYSVWGDAEEF